MLARIEEIRAERQAMGLPVTTTVPVTMDSHSQLNDKQTNAPLKVGFYGCSNTVVRVGFSGQKGTKGPAHALIDCPACNRRHKAVNFMWRPAKSFTEWDTAEVHLKAEPCQD